MYCRHFSADDDVVKYKYRTGGLCEWLHRREFAFNKTASPPVVISQSCRVQKSLTRRQSTAICGGTQRTRSKLPKNGRDWEMKRKKEKCFCNDESPIVWRDTQQKLKEKARPDSQEFIWLGHSILCKNLVVGLDMCTQTFEKSSFWFRASTKTFENDRKGGGVMVHLHWWENSARGSSNSQHDPISGIRATRHLQSTVCVCTL